MILFFWTFTFFATLAVWVLIVWAGFKSSKKLGLWSLLFPPSSLYVAWKKSRFLFAGYMIVLSCLAASTLNLLEFAGLPKYAGEVIADSKDSLVQFDLSFLQHLKSSDKDRLIQLLKDNESWEVKSSSLRTVAALKQVAGASFQLDESSYMRSNIDGESFQARAFLSFGEPVGHGPFPERISEFSWKPGLQSIFLTLEKRGRKRKSMLILKLPHQIQIEIFEEKNGAERPVTQLLLDQITIELRQLVEPQT